MTIKQQGGVFGRNPSFNDVEVESLTIAGNAVPDASTILVDGDVGVSVQGYDADTAKLDVNQTWTGTQAFDGAVVINEAGADVDFRVESDTNTNALFVEGSTGNVGVGTVPSSSLHVLDSGNPTIILEGSDGSYSSILQLKAAGGGGSIIDATGATNNMLRILTADQEKMRVEASGHVVVTNGNLVMATSGTGIDFSATAGTGTSELFDDYEEGTWTPTQAFGTGTWTSPTFDARYTKIGRVVYFSLRQNGGTVDPEIIGGLPFAVSVPASCAISAGSGGADKGSGLIWTDESIYIGQDIGSQSSLVIAGAYISG
jgi:hypothetical protein